jgi:hypothetical protein
LNEIPNKREIFRATIRCGLTANLTRDPFLGIQLRLITRQVPWVKSQMSSYKPIYFLARMPSGAVHIGPDGISAKTAIKILQTDAKSLAVSPKSSDHSLPTRQRNHASEQIQPLPMEARGRNLQPPSSFRSSHSQSRMQHKSCFVLKHDRFLRSQPPQFILRPAGVAQPAFSSREDTYIPPVSCDTLTDASNIEAGELSRLFQTDVSDAPLKWAHPTEFKATRIPQKTSANLSLIAPGLGWSAGGGRPAFLRPPKTLPLFRSPGASGGLSSGASTLICRRSIPDRTRPSRISERAAVFIPTGAL